MIKRVRIKGYKSLEDVEVELQPLTVIMGPNAAGKSNLFDALRLLSHICTKKTLKEAFEEHRGAPLEAFSYSDKGISGLLKEPVAQFSIEVDVELSEESVKQIEQQIQQMREGLPKKVSKRKVREMRLLYSITIEIQTKSGHLRVVDECLKALNKDGEEKSRKARIPFIEKVAVEYGGIQIIVNTHSPLLPTYFDSDEIVVCRKEGRKTKFFPFTSLGPLFQRPEIDKALEGEEILSSHKIMESILRGDFGG